MPWLSAEVRKDCGSCRGSHVCRCARLAQHLASGSDSELVLKPCGAVRSACTSLKGTRAGSSFGSPGSPKRFHSPHQHCACCHDEEPNVADVVLSCLRSWSCSWHRHVTGRVFTSIAWFQHAFGELKWRERESEREQAPNLHANAAI